MIETSPQQRHQKTRLIARAAAALALGIGVAILYASSCSAPFFHDLETQLLKLRYQLRGTVAPGGETVLVMIDEPSLTRLGGWPVSRERMADAVRILDRAGARVIVFDLLFTGQGGTLSDEVNDALRGARDALAGTTPALAQELDGLLARRDPDIQFAAAIGEAGNVIIPFAFLFDRSDEALVRLEDIIEKAAYAAYHRPPGAQSDLPLRPRGVLAPSPTLMEKVTASAHATVALDSDGSLRYDHPVIGFRDEYFPSLPIEAARAYIGISKSDVVVRFGEGISMGGRLVPTDPTMRLIVNHYGPNGTFETHSFADLLEGRLPLERFRDRIVLIGGNAAGVGDSFPSPFTQTLPGTEYFATVVDNILHDRFLVRGDGVIAADMAATLLAGLFAAWLGSRAFPFSMVGAFGLLAGWSAFCTVQLMISQIWLNVLFPSLAIIVSFAIFSTLRVLDEQRSRRLMERQRLNLSRYFSPRVVDELANSETPFATDRSQAAAVLFVDIVESTRVCEKLSPAEAMSLLRAFHRRVERAVFDNEGTLDRYQGDGAMATFGMPEPTPKDALNAVKCARDLAEDVARWGNELAKAGQTPIRIGVGLHHGPVLVGDIGGERQFAFTVSGDTVNVASRLEGLTRDLKTTILASGSVMQAARSAGGPYHPALAGFTALPPRRLRGRERPVALWAWKEGAEA